MSNGKLIEAINKLNSGGEIPPDAIRTLTLAGISDVLDLQKETTEALKSLEEEIKGKMEVMSKQVNSNCSLAKDNKDEINRLRGRSWAADAIAVIVGGLGIFFGGGKP